MALKLSHNERPAQNNGASGRRGRVWRGEGGEGDESERGQQGSKEREGAPKQQLITVKNAKAPK